MNEGLLGFRREGAYNVDTDDLKECGSEQNHLLSKFDALHQQSEYGTRTQ